MPGRAMGEGGGRQACLAVQAVWNVARQAQRKAVSAYAVGGVVDARLGGVGA